MDSKEQLVDYLQSWDITSSYPASMVIGDMFPMGAWHKCSAKFIKKYDPNLRMFCYIFRLRIYNVKFVASHGMPYLSKSKCKFNKKEITEDNGRIYHCTGWLETAITNIDWWIIKKDYTFDEDKIYMQNILFAPKGKLPFELRNTVMEYYKKKTLLKDVEGKEYEYLKSKNAVNSCYGMMVTAIDMKTTVYVDGNYKLEETPIDELLDKFYSSRNSFLSYQWGIFVTALSRLRLHEMLWIIGEDCIYCDTDSIKCKHDHTREFNTINERLKTEAEKAGAYADNKNGERFYLGVWSFEGNLSKFKTLGSKKYITTKIMVDGTEGIYSTIAGVNVIRGAAFFRKNGLQSFKDGTVIENSGHLLAYYNDDDIHEITVDGCTFKTASNIALIDDTYTIGKTGTLRDIIDKMLENISNVVYN